MRKAFGATINIILTIINVHLKQNKLHTILCKEIETKLTRFTTFSTQLDSTQHYGLNKCCGVISAVLMVTVFIVVLASLKSAYHM